MVVHLSAAGWKRGDCSVQSSWVLAHGGVRGNVISGEKWFWRTSDVALCCFLVSNRVANTLTEKKI
ncbi:hypothetical protein A2U01_0033135, partial [Trifolium medium]|nr:hypothetical protein [Trifolium medium]